MEIMVFEAEEMSCDEEEEEITVTEFEDEEAEVAIVGS